MQSLSFLTCRGSLLRQAPLIFSGRRNRKRALGYLPLAIEQAAAFVREVTGDFAAYREEYQQNHKSFINGCPKENI